MKKRKSKRIWLGRTKSVVFDVNRKIGSQYETGDSKEGWDKENGFSAETSLCGADGICDERDYFGIHLTPGECIPIRIVEDVR